MIEREKQVEVPKNIGKKPVRKTKKQIALEAVANSKDKLTPKARLFVLEYLACLNASEAARRSGYSVRTASITGFHLLRDPKIARALLAARKELELQAKVDAAWVVRGLREVAERSLARKPILDYDYEKKTLVQKTDHNGANVWEFDSMGANKAFELIGRHLGIFQDKIKLSGELIGNSTTIVIRPPAAPLQVDAVDVKSKIMKKNAGSS